MIYLTIITGAVIAAGLGFCFWLLKSRLGNLGLASKLMAPAIHALKTKSAQRHLEHPRRFIDQVVMHVNDSLPAFLEQSYGVKSIKKLDQLTQRKILIVLGKQLGAMGKMLNFKGKSALHLITMLQLDKPLAEVLDDWPEIEVDLSLALEKASSMSCELQHNEIENLVGWSCLELPSAMAKFKAQIDAQSI